MIKFKFKINRDLILSYNEEDLDEYGIGNAIDVIRQLRALLDCDQDGVIILDDPMTDGKRVYVEYLDIWVPFTSLFKV